MKVEKNSIVTMHYTIKNTDGKVLETTRGSMPFQFMMGVGLFLPAVEKELIGLKQGDKKTIIIPPKDGFGIKDKNLIVKIQRSELPKEDINVGDIFWRGSELGDRISFTVTGFLDDWVFLDGNHPWAGRQLIYEVKILYISGNLNALYFGYKPGSNNKPGL